MKKLETTGQTPSVVYVIVKLPRPDNCKSTTPVFESIIPLLSTVNTPPVKPEIIGEGLLSVIQ